MNSTEWKNNEKEEIIEKCFKKKLLPVAEKMRKRGIVFFPLNYDKNAGSYYSDYSTNESGIIEIDKNEIPKILKERWIKEGLTELADIVDQIVELAEQLAEVEISNEVSPFIYVMF